MSFVPPGGIAVLASRGIGVSIALPQPEDISPITVFLACEQRDWINGWVICANGEMA